MTTDVYWFYGVGLLPRVYYKSVAKISLRSLLLLLIFSFHFFLFEKVHFLLRFY